MESFLTPSALTLEEKVDYLLRQVAVLQASNDNLQLVINELRRESDASFVPLIEVCGKGKLIPKHENTVKLWLKEHGREGYHFRKCGRLLLVHVKRVNDLLSGRG